MSTAKLKPKGVLWNDLQKFEKVEILQQMPGLKTDKQIYLYKFYYNQFKHWIITNIWAVPMSKIGVFKEISREVSNGKV